MATFEQVVRARHSVRAFDRQRPVPKEIIEQAFELARQAPSNCNAQPWRVFVAQGERRDRLSRRLLEAATRGVPPDEVATPAFSGVYRQLQVACAVAYYDKIGVARDDRAGRERATLRNFEFFDAPHVAVLCMDQNFGLGVALDVGAYLQTLLLAFSSLQVNTCAQASLRVYSAIVRDELEIPDELRVLCGVSFGYKLPGALANQVHQTRTPLSEHLVFRQ